MMPHTINTPVYMVKTTLENLTFASNLVESNEVVAKQEATTQHTMVPESLDSKKRQSTLESLEDTICFPSFFWLCFFLIFF